MGRSAHRTSWTSLQRADELLEIEGIGEATLAGLKELFYAE